MNKMATNIYIKPSADMHPDRFISIHMYWFKFFGQWYNEYPILSIIFWIHLIYRVSIWWLICIFPVGGEIFYVFYTGDDVAKVAEGLYLMLSEAYMAFKLIIFMYNRDKVLILIEHLKREEFYPTEPEHLPFVKRAIWKGRLVSKGYLYMCIVAIIVGCLMPISERFQVLPTNVKYPFFDVMTTPAYQIVYLMQIYSKTAVVLVDGVLDTIMPAFIAQVLGQMDILAFNLENMQMLVERFARRNNITDYKTSADLQIVSGEEEKLFQNLLRIKLRGYIQHHISIVRILKVTMALFNSYVSKVEDAFSAAAAIQFMLSGLVICLIGIQILSIDDPLGHPLQLLWTLVYFCCMMTEVFMLCWFGDEVIWKSHQLHHAAFNGNWPDFPEDVKSTLKIFRERMKRPLRLTAGKVFILSLDTFTNILKWSYNGFAVMRSTKS